MANTNPFSIKYKKALAEAQLPLLHIHRNKVVCATDVRGHPEPDRNRTPLEIVVDASEGEIPLWDQNVTLRWRFQEQSMVIFRDPDAAKSELRKLFGEGLMLWKDAAPVRFKEVRDGWDFEIGVAPSKNCNINGCTLARAFFPGGGQNDLLIYPSMFEESRQEQIETMAHELGHIFGLRHFFADIQESQWRSEIFGDHKPFTIMNYGNQSTMTDTDRNDLKKLYQLVWSGQLTEINGTPIKRVRPFTHKNP